MGGWWQCLLQEREGESGSQTKWEPEEPHELGIYLGVPVGNNTACSRPSPTTQERNHNSMSPCIQGLLEASRNFLQTARANVLGIIHHADEPAKVSHNSHEAQGSKGLTLALQLL